ncbi:unnamed protein product [Adineta steineri]|uniref:Uncharacterized protein n=1 Tax=Adineta steineri TaxID=433720 RepID=A0A819HE54_9BILA|nr:unnamed protein product [Adineta steineri]CAF3898529.1 unnamed protein product [Adineta steineri]
MANATTDNEDSIYDDFFIDRIPEFDEARQHKQAAINHHAKQDDAFKTEKTRLNSTKKQLEEKCNEALDANNTLLNELEKIVSDMGQLQMKQTEFQKQQIDKNTLISTAQIIIENCKMDKNDLELQLQQQNNLKKILSEEYEQLEEELWNIRDKETKNVEGVNYLQLSLKALQEQISRTTEELRLNEKKLADDISAREQCEQELQELRQEIIENEKEIEKVEQQITKLNQEKYALELKQADLQKQMEQSDRMFRQLEKILTDNKQDLTQSEGRMDHYQKTIQVSQIKLEEIAESIRITNSKLEKNQTDLIATEQVLNTLALTRKALEETRQALKQTLEDLEDQQIKKANELTGMQDKLRTHEILINQTDTNIKTLEQQLKQQSLELQTLRNDQEKLQTLLADLTNQSNESSELRDEALQLEQQAKEEYVKEEQKLIQSRDLARQRKIQYEKALNEEKRSKGELQHAELEQKQAEEKVRAAEARENTANILDIGSKLLGSIKIIAALFSTLKEDLPKAEAASNEAKTMVEEKKKKCDELRKKHGELKEQTAECKSQLDYAIADFQQQQTVTQQKETSLKQCKTNAEQLVKQHRDTLRKQKQTESRSHLIDNKIQRIESRKITTTNDLQRQKEEQASYENQRTEVQANVVNLSKELKRRDEAIQESRRNMDQNRIELITVIQEQQQQQNTITQLKSENRNLKVVLDELANSEKSMNREISHQQILLESEKKTMEQLRHDIETEQSHIRGIKKELMNTTTELNGINEKLTNFEQEKNAIQENIVAKRGELLATKKQHTSIHSRVQTQNVIIQSLRQKLDQLNVRDKQVFANVQNVKDKVNSKLQEMQKNGESIGRITDKIRDLQNQQEQSEQIIINSQKESTIPEQSLYRIDQVLADREKKYQNLGENLRQSTKIFIGNEQEKTNIIERMKKLEKVIGDNKVASCERKREFEEKAIAIVKNEKEKWKNAKTNNQVVIDNELVIEQTPVYNRR